MAGASGAPVILVLYPAPLSRAQENWRVLRSALAAASLRVPDQYDDVPEIGAALVEDLGDRDLSHDLADAGPAGRARLLDEAEELLSAVRAIDWAAATRNPRFDAPFFEAELAHTRRWALEKGGAEPLGDEKGAAWDALASQLARDAADPAAGDAVPTHRDFHANNLMRAPDGRLAPIDFQDLRLGPPDYDPVSLRFERAGYGAGEDGLVHSEAVLLQRAWKVLGTFEKMLCLGREIYRPHRDTAVRVIRQHTRRGGRFSGLLGFLPA